jgi:hypothetical protein
MEIDIPDFFYIDITDFFYNVNTWEFSGSVATHGPNASITTWQAALEQAKDAPLLTTEEQLEALRSHIRDFGAWSAWSKEEIAAFTPEECNAIFIQLVSADMRKGGLDDLAGIDDPDIEDVWCDYEALVADGQASGNLYRGDDKRVYYYLGH